MIPSKHTLYLVRTDNMVRIQNGNKDHLVEAKTGYIVKKVDQKQTDILFISRRPYLNIKNHLDKAFFIYVFFG